MNWIPFVMGSTAALGATICFFLLLKKLLPRIHRRKTKKQISYDKLKRERDIFMVLLYFSGMWVMWVPQRLDVEFLGNKLGIALGILLLIVRYILQLIDKFISNTSEDEIVASQNRS